MSNRWVVSDTHFGHANILTFLDENGKNVRTFSSVEEMDETMINNWNKVVKKDDIVYHLGDVVINKKFMYQIGRCNGSKRLILGNHDPFFDIYPTYFKKVYAMRIFPRDVGKMILSHIPIHSDSVGRFRLNLHGHIHEKCINDSRYLNCCVDYPGNNYTPINLEEIRDKYK